MNGKFSRSGIEDTAGGRGCARRMDEKGPRTHDSGSLWSGTEIGRQPGSHETVRVLDKAVGGRAMRPPQARKSDNFG
jgi:hypothetical protein